MKNGIIISTMGLMILLISNASAVSVKYQDKNYYLGVLNGQIEGNSRVKVNRSLTDSVIYNIQSDKKLPNNLIIKNATAREGGNGTAFITVKQILSEQKDEVYITLNISMFLDGKRIPLSFSARGVDVVLNIPDNGKHLELRSDSPVELSVPLNYRGNIKIGMEIEDEYIQE